tara:strand:- start:176 stop:439 length:264 start_codon:yes stop_codon:yes gene_type:complete
MIYLLAKLAKFIFIAAMIQVAVDFAPGGEYLGRVVSFVAEQLASIDWSGIIKVFLENIKEFLSAGVEALNQDPEIAESIDEINNTIK